MKKNVQLAKEQKPSEENKAQAVQPQEEPKPDGQHVEVAQKEEAANVDNKEATQSIGKLIDIPKIDEDTKKMLAKAGFSWEGIEQGFERINLWAEGVEKKFQLIFQNMPTEKGIADQITKNLVQRAEEQKAQVQNQSQQSGGADLTTKLLLQALAGGGGGGGDDEFSKMAKQYALESMSLGNTFQKVMMAKMAPELADTILAGMNKKAGT